MANKKGHYPNLKPGNPGNKGGGRPPEWLREKCRKIVDKEKLIEFFADVAMGRVMDHRIFEGEVIEVPASLSDRREYGIALIDRGFGKPAQAMEVSGKDGKPIETIDLTKVSTKVLEKLAEGLDAK